MQKIAQSGHTGLHLCSFFVRGQSHIKCKSRVITKLWNKEWWLDVANKVISFDQSECIISEESSDYTLKYYDEGVVPREHWITRNMRLNENYLKLGTNLLSKSEILN